ncbi:MAG: caspase family protein [Bacteroidota bacterium]
MAILRNCLCIVFALLFQNSFSQDLLPEKYKTLDYSGFVRTFRFSPTGKYIGLTTGDNQVYLLDGRFNGMWNVKGNAENFGGTVRFTPDEKCMIFTRYQSKSDIALYSMADQKVVHYTKAQLYQAIDFDISPDGKLIAVGGDGKELKLFTIEANRFKPLPALPMDEPDYQFINSVSFSPDGKYLAAAGVGTDLYFYSVNGTTVTPSTVIPFKYWTYSLAFSNDSKYLVSGSNDSLYIWSIEKGKLIRNSQMSMSGGETTCLRFDKTGNFLVAAKENASVKIFSWSKGKLDLVNEIEPHSQCVFDIDFSSNGLFMTTASLDKTAIIWKLGDVTAWEKSIGSNNSSDPNRGVSISKNASTNNTKNTEPGRNFVFIVGINEYTYWPKLNNATKDAQDVKEVLTSRYGFPVDNVIELYDANATVKNILDKLNVIKSLVKENDNLIIYYSGHGFYNKDIDEGFWIPVNARKNEETDYLSNSTLLKYLKAINTKHIFLVADACFSGALFSQGSRGYVDKVDQFKSRWALTSGRLEVVSDGSSGTNSPFASFFLKYLKDNTKPEFSVSELIQYVKISVSNNSDQTPIGNPLKNAGDEGGEYIFRLKEK